MTLYHFGNCIILIYIPYYLAYKKSGLSEYGVFWKCVRAGFTYMITQLLKMIFLATFFPENTGEPGVNLLPEFLKQSLDIMDLAGFHFVLSGIPGKGHAKILAAGMGWATAEVILSRALFLWMGARGLEFNWIYIQKCLDSNILLVQHIATAALVWLLSRHNLRNSWKLFFIPLLLINCYKSLLLDILTRQFLLNVWISLIMKGFVVLTYGLFTLMIYGALAESAGIY